MPAWFTFLSFLKLIVFTHDTGIFLRRTWDEKDKEERVGEMQLSD